MGIFFPKKLHSIELTNGTVRDVGVEGQIGVFLEAGPSQARVSLR